MRNSDRKLALLIVAMFASTLFACGSQSRRGSSCSDFDVDSNGRCAGQTNDSPESKTALQYESATIQTESSGLPVCLTGGFEKEGDYTLQFQHNPERSGHGVMVLSSGKGFSCHNAAAAGATMTDDFPSCANACPEDNQSDSTWGWCQSVSFYHCQVR